MEDLLPSMILYVNFQTTTKNVALKTLKIYGNRIHINDVQCLYVRHTFFQTKRNEVIFLQEAGARS